MSKDDDETQALKDVNHIMPFFSFKHLPANLKDASAPFCELAIKLTKFEPNPETVVALRKLLEAKDAAVRALLVSERD